jgi:hypothetical protein
MPLLNWCNIATLAFLALPALGLWLAANGISEGPNYFAARVVVIEEAESETRTTTPGTRMGTASTSTVLSVNYHYTDRHGVSQPGRIRIAPEEIPPENRKPGSQVLIEVPVDPAEGGFKLNGRVEQGLALFLIFGLMSLPSIAQVRWRDQPAVRNTWYQFGLLVLGLAALVLWVV